MFLGILCELVNLHATLLSVSSKISSFDAQCTGSIYQIFSHHAGHTWISAVLRHIKNRHISMTSCCNEYCHCISQFFQNELCKKQIISYHIHLKHSLDHVEECFLLFFELWPLLFFYDSRHNNFLISTFKLRKAEMGKLGLIMLVSHHTQAWHSLVSF